MVLCPTCSGKTSIEGAQEGYEMRTHGPPMARDRGGRLSVMSSSAKLSGPAVQPLVRHLGSHELGTEPVDLGEIGRPGD